MPSDLLPNLYAKIHNSSSRIGDKIVDCCIFKFNNLTTMTLTQKRKQELMAEYQVHETDTGSADLQVALLTERINQLTGHLKTNNKDHSSRRGLLKMIGRRKRLLAYIQQENFDRYQNLIQRLGIRR
jgi:small subunit ribosomal protein S15